MPDLEADIYSPEKRSAVMSRIRGSNTKPEIFVRSLLHSQGYRFRLHRKDLPGRPDIILPQYRAAVFVHGCFWHQHPGCKKATVPKSNVNTWAFKLARNVERDHENCDALQRDGWWVAIVWECDLKNPAAVATALSAILPDFGKRVQAAAR